jgi:hypothetical protein
MHEWMQNVSNNAMKTIFWTQCRQNFHEDWDCTNTDMENPAWLWSLSVLPTKGTKSTTSKYASCINSVSGCNHGCECCLRVSSWMTLSLHYTTAGPLNFIHVVGLKAHQHWKLYAIFVMSLQSVITTWWLHTFVRWDQDWQDIWDNNATFI